ncbi:MAG: hypothetical protein KBS77_00225 [Bacteroidales bacterium]|nr:hypothetical protein [Candidatus Colicola faecequi]
MKESKKNQTADNAAQQQVKYSREELRRMIAETEQDFRHLQERYDLFVMRHYAHRYESWFEDTSDLYRRGIRKRFFRLLRLERELAQLS